ncbi:MAG: hypothetical protein UR79_C0001G0146 [Candidatus Campbellbacteria bacterium GW2011_GWD1_35_49]|nr:MAG: hypothetical protein UR74_C0001G0183 [Candidatus Campbellbacteria bacterium GW2011_GWD2_35_24]KKP76112.1 MAG: hypothetical protein UR75_C0001G0146 [Candidatus Campbellbacteria bacterium GW2011_GWC2_35_28]KKP77301.1 MAG: hypothetical protein UR76_C0001G0146 [Candidatus Campbellbacteria bacterium GW2011_GWC1_35_31]KKP79230.1 MAG: hypothetical protein UR79_C0001G0146 [Candidatus Campbellbacteria bacterium GW2011_GWD1_35_49]
MGNNVGKFIISQKNFPLSKLQHPREPKLFPPPKTYIQFTLGYTAPKLK